MALERMVTTIVTTYRLKIDPYWTAVSEWTDIAGRTCSEGARLAKLETMRHRLSRIEQI